MPDENARNLRAALDSEMALPAAVVSQRLIRTANERRVLTVLRLERRLSRAEIARRLGLTRSTVTSLVETLLARGLLIEPLPEPGESDARLGRPGIAVSLNPAGGFFAGVEVGVGVLRFALIDLALQQVETAVEPLAAQVTVDHVVERVAAFAAAVAANPAYGERFRAFGVTVPGLVRVDGFVVHLPMIGWKQVDLLGALQSRLTVPIAIENNANAAAFGEVYSQGAHAGGTTLFLKLGAGCGGAAILGGRLLRGVSGSATEFGHIRVGEDGPVCSCGRVGCLEPRVNIAGLRRALGPANPSDVTDMALPASVAAAAIGGDGAAQRAVGQLSDDLARGLATLTHVFNPSRIVLGGAMRPVLLLALPRLRTLLQEEVLPGMSLPELTLSHLAEFECAAGVAMIAHQKASDVADFDLVSLMGPN